MANEVLTRTPTSSGNRKKFTWAGWIKRNDIDASGGNSYQGIFAVGTVDGAEDTFMFSSDQIRLRCESGSDITTSEKYRDPGNWMHVMMVVDTTLFDPDHRCIFYVNGVKSDSMADASDITQNANLRINSIDTHYIGEFPRINNHLDGQISDVFLVDGQALTPDVFGFYKDGDGYISVGSTQATDFRPGQWMPHSPRKIKKDINRRGGFGANGFYLPMNDSSNPGADFHCDTNSIITLKGEDLPQPRNGAPTTSDAYVSQLRQETGELAFDGVVKFDGTDDYLEIPDSDDFDFGSGDFTVEAFVEGARGGNRIQSVVLNQSIGGAASNSAFYFGAGTDGTSLYLSTSGSSWTNFVECSTSSTLHNNGFHHVAWQRRSNTLEIYVDGILQPVTGGNASFTGTINNSSRVVEVGRQSTSGSNFNGLISNLRVVKGTAVYTGNFTPPTEPLTNITNTKLLCCNSSTSATAATVTPGTITANGAFATRNELTGYIVLAVPGITGGQGSGYGDYSADIKGSGTNKTLTAVGNASVDNELGGYYGSAMTFDGNGDEFTIPANVTDLQLGGGDFTIEAWVYPEEYNSGNMDWIGKNGGSAAASEFEYGILSTGQVAFYHSNGSTYSNTGVYGVLLPNGSAPVGQWTHIVGERHGNTFTAYINGVAAGVVRGFLSGGSMPSGTADLCIGSDSVTTGTNWHWDGRIQDLRIYKGLAKYKGGFDVPKPYTPVGIEAFRTTADTCKNNFATLNYIAKGSKYALSDGNLKFTNSTSNWTGFIGATHGFRTGKWYWEVRMDASTDYHVFGIMDNEIKHHDISDAYFYGMTYQSDGRFYAENNGGNSFSSGNTTAQTIGDVVMLAVDMDAKKMWLGINGSWLSSGNPSTGANPNWDSSRGFTDGHDYTPIFLSYGSSGLTINFGQNPSFSGQETAGTNADDNGKGLFKYAPPTGFLALCEDNLSTPAITDPGKHFKTVLYTGDGNIGHSVTGVGFKPDFVWLKGRTGSSLNHILCDSVRGPVRTLFTNNQLLEYSDRGLNSFDDDGFTLYSSGGDENASGFPYVAWCWKAGGPAVTNNDGTITSQVSANQTAGFSIATYTGSTGNYTFGHGLGIAPKFVIIKNRSVSSTPWFIMTNATGSWQYGDMSSTWGGSAAQSTNSSIINLANNAYNWFNQNNNNYVAYSWVEIEGYSKIGSYEGNADTDGPFVYCGFKPAWILIKWVDGSAAWVLHDSSRISTNPSSKALLPNDIGPELDAASLNIDFLSNGFKIRNTNASYNNASTYVFMAFAESPFQTANAK